MRIRDKDMSALARLWHELSEFPAGKQTEAMDHCLTELSRIVGACNAFWIGATREVPTRRNCSLRGWTPRVVWHLHYSAEIERRLDYIVGQLQADDVEPHTRELVAQAGQTRCLLRAEMRDDEQRRRSWNYDHLLREVGIHDRLVGAFAVNAHAESFIGLDRASTDPVFGQRERDLLQLFLLASPSLHHQLMKNHGLLAQSTRLMPRERSVLDMLLERRTEHEIARELGVSTSSAHRYVLSLYRKYGVMGRSGLIALWSRAGSFSSQSPKA